ncbi:beta-1,3-galactosyltransferase 5-like [Physella acuta]|uniref:beta-1,3-galactosyltransferase 5-like n=1 Tax=Physella acuta TaxID=109671 RepID=UPI0027DB03D2|nr:beta-1,3-galactosyltransferase 5-like [Physella acuta]
MGPVQIRLLLAGVLVVSLVANLCMLLHTQNFPEVVVARDDRVQWEARQMVSKVIESFDLLSVQSSKALVLDSLLNCVLDQLKPPEKDVPSYGYQVLENLTVPNLDAQVLQAINRKLLAEVEKKKQVISFLSQPIIDNHVSSYTHNPENACAEGETEVLFVVPSAPENFEKRGKVRQSDRGEFVTNESNKAKLLFFLGKPENNNQTIQSKIDEEANQYQDIVQENFPDVYKNIRLKAMSMLKWAITYCKQTSYVIRTDDDVKVNTSELISIMKRTNEKFENFILGDKKENWEAVRNNASKYYLPVSEYSQKVLPPFALGGLLGYPLSTVTLLYNAALRIKPIWLDDVFITGICAPKVNVPLLTDPGFTFVHRAW